MLCRWPGKAGWLVACAVGCWPSTAAAEEKARLVYVRGAGTDDCPDEVQLRLWVIARLGYDPFSPQASRVVLARIERSERQLLGSVEVADKDGVSTGRRELSSQAAQCQELARALALSISLAIDPERANAAPALPAPTRPTEPAPTNKPPPPQLPPPSAPAPAAPARQAPPIWRVSTGAVLLGSVGVLPGLAFGGAVALGVRQQWLSLAVEGRGWRSVRGVSSSRGASWVGLFGAQAWWAAGI